MSGQEFYHYATKWSGRTCLRPQKFSDAEIMAENRNPRWRPSAILELMLHHIRPPTQSFHWATSARQISCKTDEVMAIWIFGQFGLKCLFTPQIFRLLGVWTPKRDGSSSRPPKGTSFAGTALSPILVEIGQAVRPGRVLKESKKERKKARKETTVANWVVAQTTHVDAAICGLACRVVFGR